MPFPSICVIGGGSWATALVKIFSENLPRVSWFLRNESIIESLNAHGHNHRYLTDVHFSLERLQLYADLRKAQEDNDILILAVPSAFLENTLTGIGDLLRNKIVFSAIKGIIPETGLIVGEHLHSRYQLPYSQIGVITGPCHAEEVALEKLSYLTIASENRRYAEGLSRIMDCEYINVTVSKDIYGTEYAAVLKNIYAIAAGIAHGLGYGDNFLSVLISNSIREIQRFTDRIHPIEREINESAYLGDLLVTAYSLFSRNRTFGTMLGKGYTVNSAIMEMNMIAEGYYAVKSAYRINQRFAEPARTPIIDSVYSILYENASARRMFRELEGLLD